MRYGVILTLVETAGSKRRWIMRTAMSVYLTALTAAATLLLGCVDRVPGGRDRATTALHQLFQDEWENRLETRPLFATEAGDHRYDDRLDDVSLEAQQRYEASARGFLERLLAIDRDDLSEADRVNYDVFGRLLRDRIAGYEFHTYLMPITNRSGFHISFAQLPDRVPLATVRDYENYTSRLSQFRRYAGQHIELMRAGIASGYVLPRVVLVGYESAIESHIIARPEESLFYKPFERFPPGVPAAERGRLEKAAKEAITTSLVPGYEALRDFMAAEYLPAARESIGASSLPDGRAYYEHCVHRYTTLDVTPQEVHDIGLKEVARIREEMNAVIGATGFDGTFQEFVELLRTDSRFYVTEPDALMKEVALVLKKMDGQLPTLFKTLPRTPYGIKPVPDYIAPKTTTAYYEGPAGDGTRAGFYYVNCYDLASRPLYEIEALSLHEAVPGHHLQTAIQMELEDMPAFRRFAWITAFGEGWALYAERLGLETGFYRDPYSNFGRLTYEMWRACRLVVDTGIHYLGWSRQRAIDFMAENTALTLHNITTEVDRYISWPGQALGYKIGELKIRDLRSRAERELGTGFDVQGFHDVVLGSGSVPLDVLEANVLAWIERCKREG
jgi:uncharacterized protein (DUF885 family)